MNLSFPCLCVWSHTLTCSCSENHSLLWRTLTKCHIQVRNSFTSSWDELEVRDNYPTHVWLKPKWAFKTKLLRKLPTPSPQLLPHSFHLRLKSMQRIRERHCGWTATSVSGLGGLTPPKDLQTQVYTHTQTYIGVLSSSSQTNTTQDSTTLRTMLIEKIYPYKQGRHL